MFIEASIPPSSIGIFKITKVKDYKEQKLDDS